MIVITLPNNYIFKMMPYLDYRNTGLQHLENGCTDASQVYYGDSRIVLVQPQNRPSFPEILDLMLYQILQLIEIPGQLWLKSKNCDMNALLWQLLYIM